MLWLAFGAVAAATALIALVPRDSTVMRLTNLDLTASGFRDTYLMTSKSEPDKAFVVDRRDSTIRRSNNNQPGRKWDVTWFPGPGPSDGAHTWLVKSKRIGKGTVLMVPALEVDDWVYPFLYEFVARKRPELGLPEVYWTNLYVNRIYAGLYLRVSLPFDLRKKDGGIGVLREIITVQGSRSFHVNSRFEDVPGIYAEMVTESHFPDLLPPPPALEWLSAARGSAETTVLMSNLPPYDVSLLPLPISIPTLFQAMTGRLPDGYFDERFRRWSETDVDSADLPFDESEIAEMHQAYAEYQANLRNGLNQNAAFLDSHGTFHESALSRQESGKVLGFSLTMN